MTNWLSPKIILPELHAALGFGITLGLWVFLHPWFAIAFLVFEAILIVKETLWDPRHERDQPFLWAGAQDLGWYQVGVVVVAFLIRFL